MPQQRTSGFSRWACFFASSLLLLSAGVTFAAPQGAPYKIVRRIPVGGDGSWDYLRVDPDAKRIYVSRTDHMMVVDEVTGKVIGDLPGTKGIHGMAIASDLGKGYTSNGSDMSVTVFDLKTLKASSVIKVTGANPDGILYDPQSKRVFTFNHTGKSVTAIDATTDKVAGTLALAGQPEEAVADGKGMIYVNVEDKSTMVGFDAKTLAVKSTWPLAPCEGPSALAFDSAHRRLFAACDKVMVVVNADTGKVVASPPIGGDPDGNGYDPATGLLFASCKEGLISVIHQDSPDKYSSVANITTQSGTRTMTIDLKTHHVFTMTADYKPAAKPTPDNPRPRPTQIAGSFVILELAQ